MIVIPSHPGWPGCLQRHLRLRELAPHDANLHAFYGPYYLFLHPTNGYIVVDTVHDITSALLTWDEVLARYPGFDDVALRVGSDLDAVIKARRRGQPVSVERIATASIEAEAVLG